MSSPHSNRSAWMRTWVVCVISGLIAYRLWPAGQAGDDVACLGSSLLWLFCTRLFFTGFARWDFAAEMRRLRKASERPSRVGGEAEWGGLKDAKEAGLLNAEGFYIGELEGGQELRHPGTHMLTVASSGMGKGTSVILPNLCTYPGSLVALDVKGELSAVSRKARERFGEVVVLNPFREKMTRELGLDLGDTRYNPLRSVRPGPEAKDEAEMASSWMLPGQADMTDSERYWNEQGQQILTGTMLMVAEESAEQTVTIPELRQRIMVAPDDLIDFLTEMATSSAAGGVVAEIGGRLVSIAKQSPKELSACLGSAQRALKCYGKGPLSEHVSGDDFDFAVLKERVVSVLIVLPPDREVYMPWMNLVLSSALEVVARDRTVKPVQFILDEVASCGFIPGLLRSLALGRSSGHRIFMALQQLSQAERIYGKGWKEIVGLCECITTFGVWEPETLKYLSEWAGQETVRDVSYSTRPGDQFGGDPDFSFTSADRGRPLIRPEEIRQLGRDEQLVFFRNAKPMKAKLVSYLDHREWSRHTSPNPYHRRTK